MNHATAAARQLAARQAGFAAIDVAERRIALGATSPAQLEALADAILAAVDGAAECPKARAARIGHQTRQDCAIDRWAQANRSRFAWQGGGFDHYAVFGLIAAPEAAVAEALAPAARKVYSYAQRKEATRLANKTAVRKSSQGKRADNAAIKAQRARAAAIGLAAWLDA